MIGIDDIAVSYGETGVFEGVSLQVDRGSFVGLVGPNGAGKTSLVRTVNGTLTADSGSVTIDGDRVTDLGARERGRRIATVPQSAGVAFDFDVETVVAMGRTPHRSRLGLPTDADRDAVERALDRTDTDELAERSIGSLSGGERQRVFVARALAQEAPGLLLDEPTKSLDVGRAVAVLDLVRKLAADGRAVLAAVHDLDLAARFCDRLVVLDGGVVTAGRPAEVLTDETVSEVFDTRAVVEPHPVTGTPCVVTFPGRSTGRDRESDPFE